MTINYRLGITILIFCEDFFNRPPSDLRILRTWKVVRYIKHLRISAMTSYLWGLAHHKYLISRLNSTTPYMAVHFSFLQIAKPFSNHSFSSVQNVDRLHQATYSNIIIFQNIHDTYYISKKCSHHSDVECSPKEGLQIFVILVLF